MTKKNALHITVTSFLFLLLIFLLIFILILLRENDLSFTDEYRITEESEELKTTKTDSINLYRFRGITLFLP